MGTARGCGPEDRCGTVIGAGYGQPGRTARTGRDPGPCARAGVPGVSPGASAASAGRRCFPGGPRKRPAHPARQEPCGTWRAREL